MNEYELWFEKVEESYRTAPRWYRRRLGPKARGAMLALGLLLIPTVSAWAWTNYVNGTAHYDAAVMFQEVPEQNELDVSAENLDCRVLAGPGAPAILTDPSEIGFSNSTNLFSCLFLTHVGSGANETSVLQMSLSPVNEQADTAILVSFDAYDSVLEGCWNVSDNGPIVVPAGIGQVGGPLILRLAGDPVKTFSCAGTQPTFSTMLTVSESP